MHSFFFLSPVTLEKVPGGQSSGDGVPSTQYLPSGHGLPVTPSVGVLVELP